jgi:hypothetical protein
VLCARINLGCGLDILDFIGQSFWQRVQPMLGSPAGEKKCVCSIITRSR